MFRHVRKVHAAFAADPINKVPPEGGECPYPSCDKTFTRNDNCTKHIEKFHDREWNRRKREGLVTWEVKVS